MKHISKKTKVFIVVLSIVFVGALFAGLAYSVRIPRGSADITGTIVDNDYNNLLAGGNLVRIDDKIYFNYARNVMSYGLIEISENGAKRIYWEGPKSGPYKLTHTIRQHNGQLIMALYDQIEHYSADTFEAYEPLAAVPEISLRFQTVNQKLLYKSATDAEDIEINGAGNLCIYDGGSKEVIAGPKVESFYVVGDDVYYYAVKSYSTGEFRKYSLIDKSDIVVYKLDGYYNVFDFIMEDNYLIFGASDESLTDSPYSVYKINLSSSEKSVETVCIGNPNVSDYCSDIHCWNVYNGTVYVASHSGLTTYDVTTNESRMLYDQYAEECYIVDDTWVYFVDGEARLWRVAQNGSVVEKVFG